MTTHEQKDDLAAVRVLVDSLSPFENKDRERIIRWAREKLGLGVEPVSNFESAAQLPPKPAIIEGFSNPEVGHIGGGTRDIKTFVKEKDPKNDQQFAAVVAYFHAFEARSNERKETITSKDLIEACRLANRKRPPSPGQTLINTVASGFLDKAEGTGEYKLNAVGENLVALALPDGAEGKRTNKRPGIGKNKEKRVAPRKKK